MSTVKRPVVVCDVCGAAEVKAEGKDVDLDVFGLSMLGTPSRAGAFYAGPDGGGCFVPGSFVCEDCINGTDANGPITLRDLISVLVFGEDIHDLREERARMIHRQIRAAKEEAKNAVR